MKSLLTHIIEYKLNRKNFDGLINTLTTELKLSKNPANINYRDEILYWLEALRSRASQFESAEAGYEIYESILCRIEELIVQEMLVNHRFLPNR